MTKKTTENSEDLNKKLDGIIERTKAQNRVLNKILNEINSDKHEFRKTKVKHTK
jgi:acid phosphatase family membrane protein YuiD